MYQSNQSERTSTLRVLAFVLALVGLSRGESNWIRPVIQWTDYRLDHRFHGSRGVHPPGDDAPAGAHRVHPVLHVLHLAYRARRARGLRPRAGRQQPYMRPNFFVNTPDILHESLQFGGPPMFKIRAVLAAMMSPTWGVYSGFELFEHVAVKPGGEEYLDSEKFSLRPRDWAGAEAAGRSLAPYLRRLNEIRRAHPPCSNCGPCTSTRSTTRT